MSDGSINNDKVKEILAQLRAAYAPNGESDTAIDPHAYTGEGESTNTPELLEERAEASSKEKVDIEANEENTPRAEAAETTEAADILPKESLDETHIGEKEGIFSIPVEDLSADETEEIPFKPEKELSEKSNYYQFSILGDDTDLFPQVKHEESGLDGFESFIVRPTKSTSADGENEIHRHVDETITLTEDERFDPVRWEQMRAAEEARLKAEEEARLKAEEEARLKAEEEARLKAEEEARLKAEEEARLKAEEEARLKAEEEARLKAEEEARLKAEEEARLEAEETQKAERQEGEKISYSTLPPEAEESVEKFALLLRRSAEERDADASHEKKENVEEASASIQKNTEENAEDNDGDLSSAVAAEDQTAFVDKEDDGGNDSCTQNDSFSSELPVKEETQESSVEPHFPRDSYADDSCCAESDPSLGEESPLEDSPVSIADEENGADILPEPTVGAMQDGYAENEPDPDNVSSAAALSDEEPKENFAKEEGKTPQKSGNTSRRILTAPKEDPPATHSPRIRRAPEAYRHIPTEEEKSELATRTAGEKKKNAASRVVVAPQGGEAEHKESAASKANREEFVYDIPENIYDRIGKHPLGTSPYGGNPPPERVRTAEDRAAEETLAEEGEKDEKRLYALFPEEQQDELTSRERIDSFRTRLQRTARYSRIKLMFASVLALILLCLESASLLFDGLPELFTDPVSVGYISVILLLGVFVSSISCMKVGLHGILYKRIVPESIILVETVATIFYTFVFAVIGIDVAHFGFVSALAVVFMLFYRTVHTESRYSSFRFITANGNKLVYAPMAHREKRAELNAIGKSVDAGDIPIYRLRKTPFVDEFSARTTKVCEDEKTNLAILLLSLVCAVASAIVHYRLNGIPEQAAAAGLYVLLCTVPVMMCSSHFYAMHRVLTAAGSDSTVLGEKTVLECGKVEAIAFEDVEAFPEGSINLENLNICTKDIDTALYYFCSILHDLGGPLFDFVKHSLPDGFNYGVVSLHEIAKDGVYAEVDRAEVLFGNRAYMESKGIKLETDASSALLQDGKSAVLYVAVNGVVALDYTLAYNVSPAFEENVRRLNKKGISAVIRTYDPCLDDAMLMRISSLGDCRVHVVHKGLGQVNDFAAAHVAAGLVTNADSAKLLRMFFMCHGARRMLLVQKLLKLVCAAAGAALSVISVFLFSAHVSMPSALIALFHLLWIFLSVSVSRLGIRLPGKKEKKAKGKQNGTRKDIKHS